MLQQTNNKYTGLPVLQSTRFGPHGCIGSRGLQSGSAGFGGLQVGSSSHGGHSPDPLSLFFP